MLDGVGARLGEGDGEVVGDIGVDARRLHRADQQAPGERHTRGMRRRWSDHQMLMLQPPGRRPHGRGSTYRYVLPRAPACKPWSSVMAPIWGMCQERQTVYVGPNASVGDFADLPYGGRRASGMMSPPCLPPTSARRAPEAISGCCGPRSSPRSASCWPRPVTRSRPAPRCRCGRWARDSSVRCWSPPRSPGASGRCRGSRRSWRPGRRSCTCSRAGTARYGERGGLGLRGGQRLAGRAGRAAGVRHDRGGPQSRPGAADPRGRPDRSGYASCPPAGGRAATVGGRRPRCCRPCRCSSATCWRVAAGWLLRRGDLALLRILGVSAEVLAEGALVRSLRGALALVRALCAGLPATPHTGPRCPCAEPLAFPGPRTLALQHTVIRRGPQGGFLLAA
ncbi:hypothetical protein SGLAM104S_08606 [Streptomyces glaucescens]